MAEKSLTILIVDDDDDVRDTIREVLLGGGFEVSTATTGREALAIIDAQPFDMLIADIHLPGGLSGTDVTKSARARYPGLKCLFISGRSEPIVCAPKLDDFMAKPFRAYELIGCVWKVLRGNSPNPRLDIAG